MSEDMTILQEADKIIRGDRVDTHGVKESSFDAIASLWKAYITYSTSGVEHLSGADVAWMMVLLKIARAKHGQPVRDHFVDAAGYAAIAAELSSEAEL